MLQNMRISISIVMLLNFYVLGNAAATPKTETTESATTTNMGGACVEGRKLDWNLCALEKMVAMVIYL